MTIVPICIRTYNSVKLSGIMLLGLIPSSPERIKQYFSFLCVYIGKKKEKYTIRYTPIPFRIEVE